MTYSNETLISMEIEANVQIGTSLFDKSLQISLFYIKT